MMIEGLYINNHHLKILVEVKESLFSRKVVIEVESSIIFYYRLCPLFSEFRDNS